MPAHQFVSEGHEIFDILDGPDNEISNIISLYENLALVTYKKSCADFLEMNNDANIYIATITTIYARIELYNKIKLLRERVVYCDTDSIIYIHDEGNDLETGPFLGELTNELKPGDFIIRYVSGGLKTYAYEIEQGFKYVRAKVFMQTCTNQESLTLGNVKNILLSRPLNTFYKEDEEINGQGKKTL